MAERWSLGHHVDLLTAWALVAVAALLAGVGAPAAIALVPATFAVLLGPGYLLTVALYPADLEPADGEGAGRRGRISYGVLPPAERFVLSMGLSLAIVASLGMLILVSPLGFTPAVVGGTLVAASTGIALVAAARRAGAVDDPSRRPNHWFVPRWSNGGSRDRRHAPLTLMLVGAIVVGLGTSLYAMTVGRQDPAFLDASIVHRETGEAFAVGATRPGDSFPLLVVAGNHGPEAVVVRVSATLARAGEEARAGTVRESAVGPGPSILTTETSILANDAVEVPVNVTVSSEGLWLVRAEVFPVDGTAPPLRPYVWLRATTT